MRTTHNRTSAAVGWLALLALLTSCSQDRPAQQTLLGPETGPPALAQRVPGPPWGETEPVPIPGGIQIPGGPLIHVFAPGPESLGLMGENVEPNVITNFEGLTAIGYFYGEATGNDGIAYTMINDMRLHTGQYVAADGTLHRGTFAFL